VNIIEVQTHSGWKVYINLT